MSKYSSSLTSFNGLYGSAENCNIQPGDTIAIWGCGPVDNSPSGALICWSRACDCHDRIPNVLRMAQEQGRAEVINYEGTDVVEMLKQMTGGIGPDACIDAVGMEAHGITIGAINDNIKQKVRLSTDRPHVLREQFRHVVREGLYQFQVSMAASSTSFPLEQPSPKL